MDALCDVVLDNPQLVYFSGDVVSGRVTLTLNERILIKAVNIKFSGYAFTHWEKPIKEKKQKKNKNLVDIQQQKPKDIYTNREDYISTIHYFVGSDAASTKMIEAGTYHYNFSVSLPKNCPSVFESLFGHIRYELTVFIEYPEYNKSCYSCNIHVCRPLDLSKIAGINQEHELAIVEKKPFIKFWQRPLQLQLNIPKSGFVPGENILVSVKVLNYDLLDLTHITYKLNLVATYTGLLKKKAKMHFSRTNLMVTVQSLFGKNGNVVQNLQKFMVPDTPPSLALTECRCIQISYEIEVIVSSNQKNRHITALLPLKIGTISVHSNLQAMPSEITASAPVLMSSYSIDDKLEFQSDESNVFEKATAPTPETPTTTNSVGPTSTFREADFMPSANLHKKRNRKKSMENLDNFKPKYLFYDIPAPEQTNFIIHSENSTSSGNGNSNKKTRP